MRLFADSNIQRLTSAVLMPASLLATIPTVAAKSRLKAMSERLRNNGSCLLSW